MPSYFGRDFDDDLRRLREHFRFPIPLRVRTAEVIPGCGGDVLGLCHTRFSDSGRARDAVIYISRKQSAIRARESLAHEAAHALDDIENGPGHENRRAHRNSWGVCYARVWRLLYDEGEPVS